jgi:hypothetical protein
MQIPYKFNPLGNAPNGGQVWPIAGERGVFVYLHDDECNQSGITVWSRFLQSNNTNRMEVYSGGTAFRTTATYAHINVHGGGPPVAAPVLPTSSASIGRRRRHGRQRYRSQLCWPERAYVSRDSGMEADPVGRFQRRVRGRLVL